MRFFDLRSKFRWRSGCDSAVTIGRIKGSPFSSERITEAQLNHHVHIVGASGYGKTVLLSHIIKQRIERGAGLLFIDLKADRDTIEKFTAFTVKANRQNDLKIFSLSDKSGSAPYNLIADGTPTQLRDRIMLALNWSEEFYRNQSASFLLKLLIGLCWLRENRSAGFHLGTILAASTRRDFLEEVCIQIPENAARERQVMEELVHFSRNADNWSSLQGLRTQLESIVLSDFGDFISSGGDGINIFETVAQGKIVFLFLDTRRYGETAKAVGRFILQDLKAASARVDAEVPKIDRRPFSVIIDEFADLAQEDFIGFLDRARSSRMSIVIAHQEICDLQRISPEFAGRLMGNTSTLYAFLQKRPESAELIAKIAGTRVELKKTFQYERRLFVDIPTGSSSVREVESFVIHPNVIKSQKVGDCVVIKKYPTANAYAVRICALEA